MCLCRFRRVFGPTAATGQMVNSKSTPVLHQRDDELDGGGGGNAGSSSPSKLKKSLSRFSFLLAAQEEQDGDYDD